jgi:hypothetical protein
MRPFSWLHGFLMDLRYAARGLRKNPGFVVIVVVSLALGIGANSTIFSVMNALIYRPLSYDPGKRLVAIWETPIGHPTNGKPLQSPSFSTGKRRITSSTISL